MTDREKLVELLGANTCKHDCCEDCEYCEDRDACISYLKDSMADHLIANGVTVQGDKDINVPTKWISVKDRLPEKGTGTVLVVKRFRGRSYVDIGEVIEGRAYCHSDEYCIKAREHILTHWMPLPQPPKGE